MGPTPRFGYPLFTVDQAIIHVSPQAVIHCGDGPSYPYGYVHGTCSKSNRHCRPSTMSPSTHIFILYHTATWHLPTASFYFSQILTAIFKEREKLKKRKKKSNCLIFRSKFPVISSHGLLLIF